MKTPLVSIQRGLAGRIAASRADAACALVTCFRELVLPLPSAAGAEQLFAVLTWSRVHQPPVTPHLAMQLCVSTHLVPPCHAAQISELVRSMIYEGWHATPERAVLAERMLAETARLTKPQALALVVSAIFAWEARNAAHGLPEIPISDYFRLVAVPRKENAAATSPTPSGYVYRAETLHAVLNSDKVRLPLCHSHALHALALSQGCRSWRALAALPQAVVVKKQAHVLRQHLNPRIRDQKVSLEDVTELVRLMASIPPIAVSFNPVQGKWRPSRAPLSPAP